MKKLLLIGLLSFLSSASFSQTGMYGFNIGLGYTSIAHSHITPVFEGYHLWCITNHIYVGGDLSLQRFSFRYDGTASAASINYGELVSIRQKSSYLFFSPKIDFGIGYRKYVHIDLSGGIGVVMAANQVTSEYQYSAVLPVGDTVGLNTSYNIPRIMYRAGAGISERIPTHRYFNIMLSEAFSYIPGSLSRNTPNFYTNYFCFTVGVMHKYPRAWHETD
jgi:hypothetical protein